MSSEILIQDKSEILSCEHCTHTKVCHHKLKLKDVIHQTQEFDIYKPSSDPFSVFFGALAYLCKHFMLNNNSNGEKINV
ncbi:MAG: hypothetical protein ACFFG0_09700 [Candidatus Thorarchaeota archaeon]